MEEEEYIYTTEYQLCVEYDVPTDIFQKIQKIPQGHPEEDEDVTEGNYHTRRVFRGDKSVIFKGVLKPNVQFDELSVMSQSRTEFLGEWDDWGEIRQSTPFGNEQACYYDEAEDAICLSVMLDGYYQRHSEYRTNNANGRPPTVSEDHYISKKYLKINGRVGSPKAYDCGYLRGLALARSSGNPEIKAANVLYALVAGKQGGAADNHWINFKFDKKTTGKDKGSVKIVDQPRFIYFDLGRNDWFEDPDEGFNLEGLVVDGGRNYLNLISPSRFLVCDSEGGCVNVKSSTGSSSWSGDVVDTSATYNGTQYIMNIGVRKGFNHLSSTERYGWWWRSPCHGSQDDPFPSNKNLQNSVDDFASGMHSFYHIPNESDPNEKQCTALPHAFEYYMLPNWTTWPSLDGIVTLSAEDRDSLRRNAIAGVSAELVLHPSGEPLSALSSDGRLRLAGFMALNEALGLSSVFQDSVTFYETIPFAPQRAKSTQPKFVPAYTTLLPVFVNARNCVFDLRGDAGNQSSFLEENRRWYEGNIYPLAFDGFYDRLSAGSHDEFVREIKKCAKCDTTFVNVYAHGARLQGGEATYIAEPGGSSCVRSDTMYNVVNTISKNVVYRSTCCYGAGTLMQTFRKHSYPEQFLPGTGDERPPSPDGRSIMYIVNDTSTSIAWYCRHNFPDFVIYECAKSGKYVTYGQFVDKFNRLVKTCKVKIFKALRELYKALFTKNCIFAGAKDGTYFTNPGWRRQALTENQDVWFDTYNFGVKYPLNYYVHNGKEQSDQKAVFWKIFELIVIMYFLKNRQGFDDQLSYVLRDAFAALRQDGIGYEDAYGRMLQSFQPVLMKMSKNLGADPLKFKKLSQLAEYYERLQTPAGKAELNEITTREAGTLFRDKTYLIGKMAYEGSANRPITRQVYEKIKKCCEDYGTAVNKTIEAIVKYLYKAYCETAPVLERELPTALRDMSHSLFATIFIQLTTDYPHAGFLKTTEEFANRKFLT